MKKVILAALFAGLMTSAYAVAVPSVPPGFSITPATAGLGPSTTMEFWNADTLLVGEKDGRVLQVSLTDSSTTNVLTLSIAGGADFGLLGLTLDPDFRANPYIYTYYSYAATPGGAAVEQRLSRFEWNGSSFVNEHVLLTVALIPGAQNLGGVVMFGPPNVLPADQKLFLVVGDRDHHELQATNFINGAIPDGAGTVMRINRDGTIPSGTDRGPFFDVPGANDALQRTYAYGIRNCFGLAFDPISNALWDTENSETVYDEVNRLDPGTNSGWARLMGPSTEPDSIQTGSGLSDLETFGGAGFYSEPEFSWKTSPSVAPTAITFYPSNAFGSSYTNGCFVGSFTGNIYHFTLNQQRTGFDLNGSLSDLIHTDGEDQSEILFGNGFGIITDMLVGNDGTLYVLPLVGPVLKIKNVESAPVAEISNAKLRVKLNFAKADKDSLRFNGTLDIGHGQFPAGNAVNVSVEGLDSDHHANVARIFVVDGKGKGVSGKDSISFKPKFRDGQPKQDLVTFDLSLKKEDLDIGGLDDATFKKASRFITVRIDLLGQQYAQEIPVSYTAKTGKSGKAKN